MPTQWKPTLKHLPVVGQAVYFRIFPGIHPPVPGTFEATDGAPPFFAVSVEFGDTGVEYTFEIPAWQVHSWRPQ
jgi:hypothetical protein